MDRGKYQHLELLSVSKEEERDRKYTSASEHLELLSVSKEKERDRKYTSASEHIKEIKLSPLNLMRLSPFHGTTES